MIAAAGGSCMVTEVANGQMYEVLRPLHDRVEQDVQNIYATLSRRGARLERIERRLELTEAL
jgi:hypothetical protein